MDRLQAMHIFVSVLEQQSLSAAAKAMGVSLPTVSRVLASLERELGVRLVTRSTRDLMETESGRLYYQHCKRILDEMREAELALQSHARAAAGELRVTAPVTFGRHHVSPSVAEFLERYPRISFYLSLADHCESLTERRLDVAIRVSALREEQARARCLGYIQRAVVGSREYFARHGVPRHPRELADHNCLYFTHYLHADQWSFTDGSRVITVRIRGRLRANNQEALVDAVLAGAGLAMLPTWLVQDQLESRHLQRVLTEFEAPRTPVHAVFPSRGAPPNKVRAFVDFLADRFTRHGTLSKARLD
jgi:DNA-binding transcriptional LysR family regulator